MKARARENNYIVKPLIRFARASSYVADFQTRNKLLTQKLKQGDWYHKLRKTFSKFYRRYYNLIFKFQVGLKSLLRQGLSEPYSPVENQNDLELDFKVFFFVDSCCVGIVLVESK